MTMPPIRIALVGLGNQGKEHLQACFRNSHAIQLSAIVDPWCDKILPSLPSHIKEAIPAECKTYSSVDELPTNLIQGAIVATPPSLYEKILPQLLGKNIHLLVEKPLGIHLSQAFALLETARKYQCVLMPAVQRRFHESFLHVRNIMHEKMGRITQAIYLLELDKLPDRWRQTDNIGSLVDLGFHAIDLARDLFGDLHHLSSTLFDRNNQLCTDRRDAAAHLLFQTESKTFLRIIVRDGMEKKGESLHLQSETHRLIADRSLCKLYLPDGRIEEYSYPRNWEKAMDQQIQEFARAVHSHAQGIVPESSAKFGLITMKVMEEIYDQAART